LKASGAQDGITSGGKLFARHPTAKQFVLQKTGIGRHAGYIFFFMTN
jgi:hypothetical protein